MFIRLAMMNILITVANLFKIFEFSLVDKESKIDLAAHISLYPVKKELLVHIKKR